MAPDQLSNLHVQGYIEGYYGRLLSWSDRSDLIEHLASLELNTYCYAPKEDPQHRLHWREPHSQRWHQSFAAFCKFSANFNTSVVAGIAPGLDYSHHTDDFNCLHRKASEFLDDGCNDILVLWDDIDEGPAKNNNGVSEGAAHAHVINQLADSLGQPLWTVPRVYAAEIVNNNNYLEDFLSELESNHTVLLCGNAIVAGDVRKTDLKNLSLGRTTSANTATGGLKHKTIVWDNFYANDYCPRRLFIGPWTGREEINDYLLNPTGMPHTDRLLLDIAACTHRGENQHSEWVQALQRHGVPVAFEAIAPYFSKPFFGDRSVRNNQQDIDCIEADAIVEQAIDECLWKWKSPLAREWYPFIFGLKHDLALMQETLPRDRVLKTQTQNLAKRLLN